MSNLSDVLSISHWPPYKKRNILAWQICPVSKWFSKDKLEQNKFSVKFRETFSGFLWTIVNFELWMRTVSQVFLSLSLSDRHPIDRMFKYKKYQLHQNYDNYKKNFTGEPLNFAIFIAFSLQEIFKKFGGTWSINSWLLRFRSAWGLGTRLSLVGPTKFKFLQVFYVHLKVSVSWK